MNPSNKSEPNLTVSTSVRLPEDVVRWLDAHAAENVRSRNQEIEFLLRKGMQIVKEREAREAAATEDDRSHQTKEAVG